MKRGRTLCTAAAVLAAALTVPAAAQTAPECETPVGRGTRACTFPDGQVQVETDLLDRTIDNAGGLRTRTVLIGDTNVRVGVSRRLEAQIGWSAYNHERATPARGGRSITSSGIGDVTIGGKLALATGAESPFAVAIQPAVTVPVDTLRLGGGAVGADLTVPVTYDLSDSVSLALSPEVELTGNRFSEGRHLEYGTTIGIDHPLGSRWSTTLEYSLYRDLDPAFHRTREMLTASLGWLPVRRWQVNAGYGAGLARGSPRSELVLGLSRSFR